MSQNRLARGREGADARMDRRAIAVDETMDRVSAVDKKVLNNPKHAMNETVQNSFHSLLLLLMKIELLDKKLLQFTLHPMITRIAAHFRVRPKERGRRQSWQRNASAVVWAIRYPGRKRSCGPT